MKDKIQYNKTMNEWTLVHTLSKEELKKLFDAKIKRAEEHLKARQKINCVV